MISENLDLFQKNCDIGALYHALTYKWDPTGKQLVYTESEKELKWKHSFYIVFVLILIYQALTFCYLGESMDLLKFQTGLGLTLHLNACAFLLVYRREAKNICFFVNGILQFISKFGKGIF